MLWTFWIIHPPFLNTLNNWFNRFFTIFNICTIFFAIFQEQKIQALFCLKIYWIKGKLTKRGS